ncbi:MAG: hypothetical protein ACLQEG_11575 [Acidimicrobiales bacterium]
MGRSGFFDTFFERRLGLGKTPSTIVAGPEGGGRLIPRFSPNKASSWASAAFASASIC